MPRKRLTRDEQKQQSRDALVAAALELFAEEGLDRPSLDAICERAGYTRGAFYVHFRDREDLLVAVMGEVGNAFLAGMFEHLATAPGARAGQLVRDAAARFVEVVRAGRYPLMAPKGDPLVRPHQLMGACVRSETVRARYGHLVQSSILGVGALARDDQDAGTLRTDIAPKRIGELALALIVGAQTLAEIGVQLDVGELAASFVALLTPSRDGAGAR